ncbi:MAG: hypothetical protein LQ345_002819 [Seirophora villosa]|nr:MAG: hypothetical protein LQ345_002819 [Seirophora villosa]
MLDGLFMLLTLSTVMAIAYNSVGLQSESLTLTIHRSFLAGSLPLSFSLSQSRLQLISTVGMGVLVGTSLIVIIPEGVDTLYSASASATPLHHSRRSHLAHPLDVPWHYQRSTQPPQRRDELDPADAFHSMPGPVLPADSGTGSTASSDDPPLTPTTPGEVGILEAHPASASPFSPSPISAPGAPASTDRTPHAWVGISLILGFILMYLLDTLPFLRASPSARQSQNIYSLSDLSSSPPSSHQTPSSQRSFSTTLGLVIHAAADGIALGASHSSGGSTSLGFIIFLAIMIHKAPAAFGLTSVLLKQGLGKRAARAHLVVFSLAAPAGAVGTWVVVRALGGGGGGGGGGGAAGGESHTTWWTGVLLLFSGGTFLYVAMHTMQEVDTGSAPDESGGIGNGFLDGGHRRDSRPAKEGRSSKLVAAAVGGMLLPLITQIGHAH